MKTNRRAHFGKMGLVLAGAVLALSACGSNESSEGSATTELTVLLDWYPNALHTFLYAAEQQGYFEEAGLKVDMKVPAGTDDALKLVATGKADLALNYQMQVAIARAEDVPVKSVAAVVRHPLNQLFVSADSGIASPKDLEGKKIGFPSLPLDQAIVDSMVKSDGGDASKLNYIDIGYDLIPALTMKRVDAIIGGYINHEKLLMERDGMKLTTFDPSQFGVPDYNESVLVTGDDTFKKKEKAIRAFWAAAAKGQEYVEQHPEEALTNLLNEQNADFPLEEDVEKQSLEMLIPLMNDGTNKFGSQSEESWQSIIDWLKETGTITKDLNVNDVFVDLTK
ncbi:ABC transporter substrate-binding protein [Cohnella sp. AR92]|uniref:ABC transporter substrate-binding protein n=1 Tax=Cohnella sp. AR92 TaxID=648716 RepID=UPI001EDDA900|nr:ABC transporter substrate-binding protein [Cohnella sp. AR92]